MNIVDLKDAVFCEIACPLEYLEHHGFCERDGCPKKFGQTVYFDDAMQMTPECYVEYSQVNAFEHAEHRLKLRCPQDWCALTNASLKSMARKVYETNLLEKACAECASFDIFWERCRLPPMLTLEMPSHTKRGRHPVYVNLFYEHREMTGRYGLERGAVVRASFKWSLSETVSNDRVQFGFRPHFAAGIQIIRAPGKPAPIRKPWSWQNVDTTSLCIPMYDCAIVRAPVLTVVGMSGNIVQIDMEENQEFTEAMQTFHARANAPPWKGQICTDVRLVTGVRVFASLCPFRSNSNILWSAVKVRVLPPQAPKKRHCGSTDNSSVSKTKRRCTVGDTDAHMAVPPPRTAFSNILGTVPRSSRAD